DVVGSLALRADGRELAVGVSNRVVFFDLPAGRQVGALETGLREIRQVYYHPLTNRLAAVGLRASGHERVFGITWTTNLFGCELWNLAAGKRILDFDLRTRPMLLRFRGASDELAV